MEIVVWIAAAVVLGVNTYTDIKERQISTMWCLAPGIVALGLRLVTGRVSLPGILLALVPGMICLFVSVVSKGKLGVGDVFVLISLGLILPAESVFGILLAGSLLVCLYSVIMLTAKKADMKTMLPMVPFFALAFILNAALVAWGNVSP